MTREEFYEWLASVPDEEPFCPFDCCYCNAAYSERCFDCQRENLDE